jgi:L-iditol 2-dehydrogenase
VSRLRVGDRVVVNPGQPCYTQCPACLRGFPNKCMNMQTGGGGGGLGQYRLSREAAIFPLRPATDMIAASFAEPLACVLHGQGRARIRPGSLVVIVGSGPIGLLHMLSAKRSGARVIMSEPHPKRLAAAAKLGADVAVDPSKQDLPALVRAASDGWGADAVIVAVGNKAATEASVRLLGIQGTIILFAGMYPNRPIELDSNFIHYSEVNITGSSDFADPEFFKSVGFIERGLIDTRQLVSHVLPFERIVEGMEIVRQASSLKVVIQVNRAQEDES